jgi:hypothetical protein
VDEEDEAVEITEDSDLPRKREREGRALSKVLENMAFCDEISGRTYVERRWQSWWLEDEWRRGWRPFYGEGGEREEG